MINFLVFKDLAILILTRKARFVKRIKRGFSLNGSIHGGKKFFRQALEFLFCGKSEQEIAGF